MKDVHDPVIESLIKPPVIKFAGFDWTRTDKLQPVGDAQRAQIVSEKLASSSDSE